MDPGVSDHEEQTPLPAVRPAPAAEEGQTVVWCGEWAGPDQGQVSEGVAGARGVAEGALGL